MALTIEDLANPRALIAFTRDLEFPTNQLAEFFPTRNIRTTKYKANTTGNFRAVATPYRSWDSELPIRDRRSFELTEFAIPSLGEKTKLGEQDQLMLDAIQQSDPTMAGLVNASFQDIRDSVENIHTQLEYSRGRLLSTGKVTIDSTPTGTTKEMSIEVDFGVPSGNIGTEITLWSDTTNAKVLTRIQALVDTYKAANNDLAPGALLVSKQVFGYILTNLEIRQSLPMIGGTVPSSVWPEAVSSIFQTRGLPPIRVIDEQVASRSNTGVETVASVIDTDKVIMVPPANFGFGATVFGLTVEAMGMVQAGTITMQEAPGIVGISYTENDSPVRWNGAKATAMPVIEVPKRLMIQKVV